MPAVKQMLSAFVLASPDKWQKRVMFGVTLVFINREHKAKKKEKKRSQQCVRRSVLRSRVEQIIKRNMLRRLKMESHAGN